MPKFQIIGVGIKTGRHRKTTYTAKDERSAAEKAEADGTRIESIVRLPDDPPTPRQIAFARSLGIPIDQYASAAGISMAISAVVDGRESRKTLLISCGSKRVTAAIHYSKPWEPPTVREVEPHVLVDTPTGSLAMLCWQRSPRPGGWRVFRFDRICDVRPSGTAFRWRLKSWFSEGEVLQWAECESVREGYVHAQRRRRILISLLLAVALMAAIVVLAKRSILFIGF